ncbi:proline iminopeptidase [Lewinella marina]|uniref:Proline iminopeptidase n=1 Tax=Neolewinella marina TaxID=438751 RepID=A0A2G0CAX0_9BACT|nr:proline iminopeptidase-family hydrolase [Neolewinella marina]NJB85877.1 proline iminopeptidase [Neolewinella marina]PHK97115.1 proline iminopeptidase [Neolewinella marina]
MLRCLLLLLITLPLLGCQPETEPASAPAQTEAADYFDNTGRDDVLSGGVRMIPISTPAGEYRVWTKRVGNNPYKKVLLLHGGPGATHEYFEAADSYFPGEGIEYYYYDQLESGRSDQPGDSSLWTIPRFVSEVEQVRQALGLDSTNFFLLGHSWGGILALEYALAHQEHLKGLIISNMMSSVPEYNRYAQEVLGPKLDPAVLEEIKSLEAAEDYGNPRYEELLMNHYYTEHVLRMPVEEWPDPAMRGLSNINYDVYLAMQGPSEFGILPSASLANWDRSEDLDQVTVPTLVIGAEHDTMDPAHMEQMADRLPRGYYLYLPAGSHMAMYDDQQNYFRGVINFINRIDEERRVQ